jgi:hypothetical protein
MKTRYGRKIVNMLRINEQSKDELWSKKRIFMGNL